MAEDYAGRQVAGIALPLRRSPGLSSIGLGPGPVERLA